MKKLFLLLFSTLLLTACVTKESNTENPRGVYKMTKLIGKNGEIDAPFDQYQICTDSITMLAWIEGDGQLYINGTYDNLLNYTGENPKDSSDKSVRIYNSNSEGFALKWWSEFDNHIYFPKNDWCTELYEVGLYSEIGKTYFDILMNEHKSSENPYLGIWRLVQSYSSDVIEMEIFNVEDGKTVSSETKNVMDLLKNDKEYLNNQINMAKTKNSLLCTFSPSHLLCFELQSTQRGRGFLQNSVYNEKGFILNENVFEVTWLSDDCIVATNVESNGNITHDLMIRESGTTSLVSQIADHYIP